MGQSRRDMAVTAAIFGWFSVAWFGWTQAAPSGWLAPVLVAGSILGVVVMVAGIVLAVRYRRTGAAADSREARRRYAIIVGVEFALAGAGSAVLGATGAAEYIPVWVAAVVGAHFIPMAPVLRDPSLRPLAVVVLAVAASGLLAGLTTDVDASTVTGTGAGAALLAWAMAELLRALRAGTKAPSPAGS